MENRKTIVLVLRSGGDFSYRDVELITYHIKSKWESSTPPRIICLWNKATQAYNLGNVEIIPYLQSGTYGTWDRIRLFSPKMEQYKPFLYVDLDTAVIKSIEHIFDLVKDTSQFITLEDFWQRSLLATGLVWYPKNCEKTKKVYNAFVNPEGKRMDYFLRKVLKPDAFWQQLTNTIYDFKPPNKTLLDPLPEDADLVCFHGKPRVFNAQHISWVKNYVVEAFSSCLRADNSVSVIIPYNRDRGWLKQAINSVPKNVQLILSQGEGNWPENFNKVLDQATGKYIRWLHEDDMLTENSIEDAVRAMEEQGVDFIHGNAYEITPNNELIREYRPSMKNPSLSDLLRKNVLHSGTMMYKREVFEKVGKMDETLWTAEEFEFNLRCLEKGMKLGYCDKFLVYYRRHPAQKVRTVPTQEKLKEKTQVKSIYTK